MLDRLTRSWVLRPGRLEQVKDVLSARCRPKSKEMVIGISEGPTPADPHEARVPDLREDHDWPSFGIKSALRDEGNRVPEIDRFAGRPGFGETDIRFATMSYAGRNIVDRTATAGECCKTAPPGDDGWPPYLRRRLFGTES